MGCIHTFEFVVGEEWIVDAFGDTAVRIVGDHARGYNVRSGTWSVLDKEMPLMLDRLGQAGIEEREPTYAEVLDKLKRQWRMADDSPRGRALRRGFERNAERIKEKMAAKGEVPA